MNIDMRFKRISATSPAAGTPVVVAWERSVRVASGGVWTLASAVYRREREDGWWWCRLGDTAKAIHEDDIDGLPTHWALFPALSESQIREDFETVSLAAREMDSEQAEA